jgi:hypothetical protein
MPRGFGRGGGDSKIGRNQSDLLAERMGFELALRSAKFAFDFWTEFTASVAKFGFGEKFAPEVLKQTIHPVSAVRPRIAFSLARPPK